MSIRTLWMKAHLWVGLAIALPLIDVALSGSVLAFEDALDRALNPALSFVTPGNRPMPLDEIVPRVRVAYPDALLSSFLFRNNRISRYRSRRASRASWRGSSTRRQL